jgi:hypothetical protein
MTERFQPPHEPHDDAAHHALYDALTDAGRVREKDLRESLLSRVDRTRRRRMMVQLASGAAVLALLAMLPFLARPAAPSTSSTTTAAAPTMPPTQHDTPATNDNASPTPPASFIRLVATDRSVLDRLVITDAAPSRVMYLTDDQLLASLHEAGFPAGLVSIDGNVRIVMN